MSSRQGSTEGDPAETFATSFRLTGRLFRRWPQESQILLANGTALLNSDRGLAPRARRDVAAAVAAGRFTVEDTELALAVAGGALLGLGNLLRTEPDRDDKRAADAVTENVLRIFCVSSDEAHALCERSSPDLSELQQSDSVA